MNNVKLWLHFIFSLIGLYLDFVCFPPPYSIALHSAMHNNKYPPWASLVLIVGAAHPYLEDKRSATLCVQLFARPTFIYTYKWRVMISLFNYCKTPFCTGHGGHRKPYLYYLRKFQEDTFRPLLSIL